MRTLVLGLLSLGWLCGAFAQSLHEPTFEEILSLATVSQPSISPDGQHVVYVRQTTDWADNRYDRELWLAKAGLPPFQLTNNPDGNSTSAAWSPDGEWIAFLSDRGEQTQVYAVRTVGGAAFAVTASPEGVSDFAWSPDGRQIAYLRSAEADPAQKKRQEQYGDFAVEDAEYRQQELWLVDFDPDRFIRPPQPDQLRDSAYQQLAVGQKLIGDASFTINNFHWSPDGSRIAFTHQPDPLINSFFQSDISICTVATGAIRSVVSNPSSDRVIAWSPDGNQLLYESSRADTTSNYYRNGGLFIIDQGGEGSRPVAVDFDENMNSLHWTPAGILGLALQRTEQPLVRIDPTTGAVTVIPGAYARHYGLSVTPDGRHVAFRAENGNTLGEIYRADFPLADVRAVTNASAPITDWAVARSEVISWTSEDGTTIEGVLHKPADYDPGKKYPLFVAIHGGPTGISVPDPVPAYVYPLVQWLNRGALVLRPNYRGSAGYGEAFRSLNVRNLGVGDAWDVLSGVEHLVEQGLVDPERVGAMGWSQGGYISAFLATNSARFRAISVGAGISNWMTYYVNTDIHPFTRQYLQATPWSDPAIYAKTSPMTNINQAGTPTLIQHGEFDRRVPIANAYELYQGLQDVGVPTRLIVYKGFGHGITKPKERLAAMQHNWDWFDTYLWEGE
jgi:dipeptidyl aminopeptidase/acylaminoacyl peptidase